MEEQKVFLLVETPFSIRKPKGRLLLPMSFSLVMYVVMVVAFWLKMPEVAMRVTITMGIAMILSAIYIAMFRLSYVTVEDGYLVCRYWGLLPRRIPVSSRVCYGVSAGQLKVKSGAAVVLQIPDSDAARRLMYTARIPREG